MDRGMDQKSIRNKNTIKCQLKKLCGEYMRVNCKIFQHISKSENCMIEC